MPSTPRADSWLHIPPGSEHSFSVASPGYAADGNEMWFQQIIQNNIKSKHYLSMGKTSLYSLIIIFYIFLGGGTSLSYLNWWQLHKMSTLTSQNQNCQPKFLSVNFGIGLQLWFWESRRWHPLGPLLSQPGTKRILIVKCKHPALLVEPKLTAS